MTHAHQRALDRFFALNFDLHALAADQGFSVAALLDWYAAVLPLLQRLRDAFDASMDFCHDRARRAAYDLLATIAEDDSVDRTHRLRAATAILRPFRRATAARLPVAGAAPPPPSPSTPPRRATSPMATTSAAPRSRDSDPVPGAQAAFSALLAADPLALISARPGPARRLQAAAGAAAAARPPP